MGIILLEYSVYVATVDGAPLLCPAEPRPLSLERPLEYAGSSAARSERLIGKERCTGNLDMPAMKWFQLPSLSCR